MIDPNPTSWDERLTENDPHYVVDADNDMYDAIEAHFGPQLFRG